MLGCSKPQDSPVGLVMHKVLSAAVASDVPTALVMTSSIFRGTCCLLLPPQRLGPQETSMIHLPPFASYWFLAWYILWAWRWMRHVPLICQFTFNILHAVMSQKTEYLNPGFSPSSLSPPLPINIPSMCLSSSIYGCSIVGLSEAIYITITTMSVNVPAEYHPLAEALELTPGQTHCLLSHMNSSPWYHLPT